MNENIENKKENTKKYLTPEEVKQFQKSEFYRDELERYVGETVVVDVPYDEFKPFKEDKDKACFRSAKVVQIGDENLSGSAIIQIEHIWVIVKKTVKIDSRKPLRAIGTLYEYPKQQGDKTVRNVGLNIRYVTQNVF